MKPTHILVPIDKLGPPHSERIWTQGFIYQFPKVDLSEEGIKEHLIVPAHEKMPFTQWAEGYNEGVLKFAKDLLNTKP